MTIEKVIIDTAAFSNPQASLLLIYTGGTIGMAYDENREHLVPFNFSLIVEKVPELKKLRYRLTVINIDPPIDSSNVSLQEWFMIASLIKDNYEEYDGFVILHGTDTMAYSASALSYLLENLHKPVIFTGAQVPIGRTRTDARENLISAMQIAAKKIGGKSAVPEVCIYFHNLLIRGNRAKKVESSYFNAFKSENYPLLAKAGIKISYTWNAIRPHAEAPFKMHDRLDNRVAILKLFPGITPGVVKSILQSPDIRGVVLETFGAGNAPIWPWLLRSLQEAIDSGIHLLNVSQCDEGRVEQGRYETSKYLLNMGVIGGADITTEAAITKLMFVLGLDLPHAETRELLATDLRGEITP